jgi:protease-4
MSERKQPGGLKGILIGIFRGIDLARRLVVNALFLLIILLLWIWTTRDGLPKVPASTVLVVDPHGLIVEQLAGDAVARALQKLTGSEVPEALLKDLVDAIDAGRDDERVKALFLDLDQLLGGALPKLEALRASIDAFRESGKPVIAAADFYDNSRYHLAAAADEIYLHPMGLVLLEGYGRFDTYMKEGLDRYGVEWNVFRVGEYKSAVEPFLRDGMSDEVRRDHAQWLGALWSAYLEDVAAARGTAAATIAHSIDHYAEYLAEDGGDAAALALRLGLVDHVAHDDAVRRRLIEIAGEDAATHSFHRVDYRDYLLAADGEDVDDGEVAVVVARGTMLPGDQPPGLIGGESTAELIREARQDEGVKALVLRVDSGGGSTFAAEVIRRELELVREAGKPVVISMGSYAASGGYWIATAGDEIWASPNTVTGSIGIFGFFPTFQKPLARYLGVHVDGVGTTWLAGVRPDRELPEQLRATFELLLDKGYRDFLGHVAAARDMTVEDVDAIAQGRVFTGARAHELGLVDHLGGLDDAVAAAARRAELGDEYGVRYLERELGFGEQALLTFLAKARAFYRPAASRPALADATERFFLAQIDRLEAFRDPLGIYAHCLCELDALPPLR